MPEWIERLRGRLTGDNSIRIIIILGAAGIANMWIAVFADVGVAIICILNSMRMLVRR